MCLIKSAFVGEKNLDAYFCDTYNGNVIFALCSTFTIVRTVNEIQNDSVCSVTVLVDLNSFVNSAAFWNQYKSKSWPYATASCNNIWGIYTHLGGQSVKGSCMCMIQRHVHRIVTPGAPLRISVQLQKHGRGCGS